MGAATARVFAAAGARVLAADVDDATGALTVESIVADGVASLENAPKGIRVNTVCPGPVDTPMMQKTMALRGVDETDVAAELSLLGRLGQPEEIARASLWLCSDQASFVTGAALAVDAGYT